MPPIVLPALDPVAVADRRAAWDRVMTSFVPGLPAVEEQVATAVEAVRGGPPRRVLDLGGGPGLVAERFAARWPGATVALVDLDPVLLALAASTGAFSVVDADLCEPGWEERAGSGYDLVTLVMTVHYLREHRIRELYAAARRVLVPGGLLVVADLMPDDDLAGLMHALDPAPGEAAAELAWAQWWSEVGEDPAFTKLRARRTERMRDRVVAEFTAGVSWHRDAALAAGFGEAGLLWREGRYAAMAAI